jgi:CheY-like chemotaxis protein
MLERILIVEDNENLRHDLQKIILLDAPNRQVVAVQNEFDAAQQIAETSFSIVITDIKLDEAGGTETGGLEVLRAAQRKDRTIPVIVVTAFGKMEIPEVDGFGGEALSVEEKAKKMGIFAYVPRPHPEQDYLDVIREEVNQALEKQRSFATGSTEA